MEALKQAGCKKIFEDKTSGGRWDRPQLQEMINQLRAGDIVVVWKLDRLSRSLKDLLNFIEKLRAHDAGFRSLTEHIDTTTPAGVMLSQMLGSFAEFERAMIRQRTKAGLESARNQGRIGGRPSKLTEAQKTEILQMVTSGQKSATDVTRLLGVHGATFTRLIFRLNNVTAHLKN